MCIYTSKPMCKVCNYSIEYPSWEPIFRVPSCRRRRPVPSPIRSAATHFSPSIRSDLFSVWSVRPHHRSTRPDPLLQTRCGTRSVVRTRRSACPDLFGRHYHSRSVTVARICLWRSSTASNNEQICSNPHDCSPDLVRSCRSALISPDPSLISVTSVRADLPFQIRHFHSDLTRSRPAVRGPSLPSTTVLVSQICSCVSVSVSWLTFPVCLWWAVHYFH